MRATNQATLNESKSTSNIIARLFLLNIFLTVSLVVLLATEILARDISHVSASLKVTLIAAVTAIVTSCFLSIGKKLISKRHIFNKYIFPRLDVTGQLWKSLRRFLPYSTF